MQKNTRCQRSFFGYFSGCMAPQTSIRGGDTAPLVKPSPSALRRFTPPAPPRGPGPLPLSGGGHPFGTSQLSCLRHSVPHLFFCNSTTGHTLRHGTYIYITLLQKYMLLCCRQRLSYVQLVSHLYCYISVSVINF